MRKRVRLSWHPTWTPEIEKWTAHQVKKNLWRFDSTHDLEDVMQEARLLFHVLERKYPIVNEAAHFFTLFKTSLSRMFIDKARKRQKTIHYELDHDLERVDVEGMPNFGFFNLLVEEMPQELKIILGALTGGRVRLKLDRSTQTLRPRENHNMRLRRCHKLTTKDPVGDLRGYFADT
jgi:DNA-directed RNA polymerase specialized sigma24 family protein